MESCAFGVPTITTDKAGFGLWVLNNFKNGLKNCGVTVISREDTNYSESVESIAKSTIDYISQDTLNRSEARYAAFLTAEKADWNFFIKYYDEAFDIAFARAKQRQK